MVRFSLLALPAAALALASCTQVETVDVPDSLSGERRVVAERVADLQEAARGREGEEICRDLLTAGAVKRIERASGKDCAEAVEDALSDADAFEVSVQRVAVRGASATVTVRSEAGDQSRVDTLELEKVGREWRFTSVGGRPRP